MSLAGKPKQIAQMFDSAKLLQCGHSRFIFDDITGSVIRTSWGIISKAISRVYRNICKRCRHPKTFQRIRLNWRRSRWNSSSGARLIFTLQYKYVRARRRRNRRPQSSTSTYIWHYCESNQVPLADRRQKHKRWQSRRFNWESEWEHEYLGAARSPLIKFHLIQLKSNSIGDGAGPGSVCPSIWVSEGWRRHVSSSYYSDINLGHQVVASLPPGWPCPHFEFLPHIVYKMYTGLPPVIVTELSL